MKNKPSSYLMEQRTFIEVSYNNNINIGEKVFRRIVSPFFSERVQKIVAFFATVLDFESSLYFKRTEDQISTVHEK